MKDKFGREWRLIQLKNSEPFWKSKDGIMVRDLVLGMGLIQAIIWCMGWLSKLGGK